MKKIALITILSCSFFIFSMIAIPWASDLKVKSMGQMTLIIEDQDNQLNLYDFGSNPAWLIVDQNKSWLRPFIRIDNFSGKFKRTYDPETDIDFNAFFEGVKIIDKNQTFRGLVDYHDLILNHVYQAINRNPYEQHPFRLADNTTGNIHYWGPAIATQYSRKMYHQKLFWGASLGYQIETGLKDNFPQPRTIYRHIEIGTGIAYRMTDQLSIGSTFNYSRTQEFTEVVPPGSNELRTIFITKFRGEIIGTVRVGSMERFTRTKTYQWGWQTVFKPFDYLESALLFNYHVQNLDAIESRARPVKDGTWKLNGNEIHWKNRLKLPGLPFRLGFVYDHIYFNDWATHPDSEILLGDDVFTENSFGFGIAYLPNSLPLIFGIEFHFRFADKEKKDYVSSLTGSGNMNGNQLKAGAEIGIRKNWKIRAGYIYEQNEIDATLLSFSEFKTGNKTHDFTFGVAHYLKSVDIEFYGYYSQQQPTVNQDKVKRNQLGLIFAMKFYRD